MSYNNNVPQSGQTLGGTRQAINTNFALIKTLVDQNHETFGSGLGQGKHKFLQMPEQLSAPTTAVNEGGVYTKVGTNPAETNLFFRAENNGFEYQITKVISASTGRFSNNTGYLADHTGGWTFLAGGLILQYGLRSSPGAAGVITFPIAFPSGGAPFFVSVSLYRGTSDHNVLVDSGTPPISTQFNYRCDTAGSAGVYWSAIGI